MTNDKQRQPHADFIIMQAEDMSLRFDYKDKLTSKWLIYPKSPCEFNPNWEYRLHEREFPKTSLSDIEFTEIWNDFSDADWLNMLLYTANAAIRQYILDTDKESK